MLNAQPGVPIRSGVRLETCFIGPGMRDQPTLAYVPSRLSMVPVLLRTALVPDVVVIHVSRPHRGRVSMGTEVNILPAAVDAARAKGGLVIAVTNPHMPFTYGDGVLRLDEVDLVVELDLPLSSPGSHDPDATAWAIGSRVAALVPDRATLQTGIGAVPDAALHSLIARRGLRIWSEMISDGVLRLEESGALDPKIPVSTSFLFGSAELVRMGRPQPAGPDAAHRDREQPRTDRPQPGHGVDQHGAGGGSLRAGQRRTHPVAAVLRVRWAVGLRLRGTAVCGRAGAHRAQGVASRRPTARPSWPPCTIP